MATLYAVHKGYGDPEICETRADAEQTAKWYTDYLSWNAHDESGHAPGEIEEIPASLPSETGIRTVFDIHESDGGGYSMGYYPATIEHGHADLVGCGPLCGECARAFLRANADDETVTLFGEPEYESADGLSCEDCGKSLCEPYCQCCTDQREEEEPREWYQCDNGTWICPRCMATGRHNAEHGTQCRAGFNPNPHAARIVAQRLAPGVYDVHAWEYDPIPGPPPYVSRSVARGTFYAPSCSGNMYKVAQSRRAESAR